MRWGVRLQLSLLVVLLCAGQVSAAFEYRGGSVRSSALAGAVDLFRPSPLVVVANPAMAPAKPLSLETNWARLYGLPDFDLFCGAASYSRSRWSATIAIQQLAGSEFYWERKYTLALSHGILNRFRLGAAANYLSVQFGEGYRSLNALALDAGILVELASDKRVALSGRNLNTARFAPELERMPREASLAFTWALSDEIAVSLANEFVHRLPDRFCAGQVLTIARQLTLLVGVSTNPTDFAGGLSLQLAGIEFEYAYGNSVYLGGTHRIGVQYAR